MITITGLRRSFGARDLFAGADLRVSARDRIAIVGPNGSGKTTLLEMIAGEQSPDSGTIQIAADVVVGYLRQETEALRGRTLIDEVMTVGSEVTDAGHRLGILETEMAETPPGPQLDRLIREYGRLQDRFATLGGYSLEAEATRILAGLAFRQSDLVRRTEELSGGWLMRLALAKLLLAAPDLLMLDEPTNHLDVESVEWLERFLADYDGAILLISHDRDFINAIATRVVEIDRARLVSYTGDFESFVRQREAAVAQAEAAARNHARKVATTQAFIDRFRYKATKAKQVQSRIRALERAGEVHEPRGRARKTMKLSFPQPPKPGRIALELRAVRFGYADEPVYRSLDLVLERGHKVALVGPNGAGKSTLLKLLAGVLEPQAGERVVGHNARVAYFAQHQAEELDAANRVIEELEKAMPPGATVRARDLLGRFLFSGDDVEKPVTVLSGGERTRLALAKLLVSPANVLCLDEPTNHLDMPSRDALEDALEEYTGVLVLITHDRHLIRAVANHIVEVVDGKVSVFDGDYDYYLTRRVRDETPPEPVVVKARVGGTAKERRREGAQLRARTKELRDRVRTIENELDQVAAETARLTEVLADPGAYAAGEDVASLVRRYDRYKKRTLELEARWEEAAAALDEAGAGELNPAR
ncbi:MAG: ABC-F family ATP-binding cassette domain-containing protein [Actinomycetota bacterium]